MPSPIRGDPIQALCETPRLDAACRDLDTHSSYRLLPGAEVTEEAGRTACAAMGMHLLELNSSAELVHVRQVVAPGASRFWLGAQYSGSEWLSPTTCPQVFAWRTSEPDFSSYRLTCAVYDAGVATAECDTSVAAVICEANAAP